MNEQSEIPEHPAVPVQSESDAPESMPRRRTRRPLPKKTSSDALTDAPTPFPKEEPASGEHEAAERAMDKPRRRRPRKPPPGHTDDGSPLASPRPEALPFVEMVVSSADIQLGTAQDERTETPAASPEPGTGRRRRKRRRRRKSKKPQTGDAALVQAEEEGQRNEGTSVTTDTTETDAPPLDEQPVDPDKSRKRRRRRKGKKTPGSDMTDSAENVEADTEPMLVRDATKRILINARFAEEQRVAIVEGSRLTDFYAESSARMSLKGNIFKGTVEGLAPSLQAAFVDFGRKKRGFLQFREVMPEFRRGENILEEGQEILVQVEQDERDAKGASLTTFISLPGRYIVMLPGQQKVGISRKIEDREDRDRLKETFNSLKLPKGMGFILRTASGDSLDVELDRDLKYLTKLWSRISADAKKGKAPKLVYQEHSVTMRALRDYLTSDTSEILIDDAETFRETKSFLQKTMPWRTVNITHYQGKEPLFSVHGVEKQIEDLANSRVKLPSGGTIVFGKTEALTAIDVNSAKSHKEDNIEETALSTNLEAAGEIARQLRLRDIGGLVVIDFIDMRSSRSRSFVESRLKESLIADKASIELLPISRFGLLEMTRERLRPAYAAAISRSCPLCSGHGTIPSDEHVVLSALRELHMLAESNPGSTLRCHLSVESANLMSNTRRQELTVLEQRHQVTIQMIADKTKHQGQYSVEVKRHK